MYVIIDLKYNSVLVGPAEWDSSLFSAVLSDYLDSETYVLDSYREELPKIFGEEIYLYRCLVKEEKYNPFTQMLGTATWSIDEKTGMRVCDYKAVDKSILDVRSEARRLIANERWKKENTKIEVNLNGTDVIVSTDRELRKSLYHKLVVAEEGYFNWKFKNTVMSINTEDLKFLIKKIDEHIQKSYEWESSLVDQIRASNNNMEIEQILKNNIESFNSKRRRNE